ncbi:hypothetical protein CRG98_048698, partial [Punica granatum]
MPKGKCIGTLERKFGCWTEQPNVLGVRAHRQALGQVRGAQASALQWARGSRRTTAGERYYSPENT